MMKNKHKAFIASFASAVLCLACAAAFVDGTGSPVIDSTKLGDINMGVSSFGDLKTNVVESALATNVVKDIVTNVVIVGYSDWTYTGDISTSQSYSITYAQSGSSYVFTLWDTVTSTSLGTSTTSELNPLSLSFTVSAGTIVATRTPKIRNALGLARYSDVQEINQKIDTMDTSYYRVSGITNKNQSVQYVNTPAGVTSLSIQLPDSGMTKDWLVYVLSVEDLTLVLPPANYWVVSESVTNSIPAATPTALYFSQITDDTYSLARQELIPITIDSQGTVLFRQIREKMKQRPLSSRFFKAAASRQAASNSK